MYSNTKKAFFFLSALFLVAGAGLFLTNCSSSDDSNTTTTITLTSNDFPSTGVCSGGMDVTTTAFTAAVAGATSFTFMHKPFSSDADIPFICGKEGVWDASDATAFGDSNTSILFSDTIASLITGTRGSVMICNTGFDFTQLDYGFHDATTFRGEITFTDGTKTHRARFRFTVSGADAGKTLASLGLALTDLVVTDGSDNVLSNGTAIFNLLSASPTNVTLKVKSGGTTHITATGGIICAKEV
ncbi:MAG: hypothetical protein ACE5FU_12270 [Nitrospinota bacterium]